MLTRALGSDPQAGKPPSVLTRNEILRCVSLYYLTQSFLSSVFTYAQNPMAFRHAYTKAPTAAPMFLSQFKYNVGFWPRPVAERVGNLMEFQSMLKLPTSSLCSWAKTNPTSQTTISVETSQVWTIHRL